MKKQPENIGDAESTAVESEQVATPALRLSVIGTGYLGATHAACMAELGYEVLGVDVDPDKVALLQAGRIPFY